MVGEDGLTSQSCCLGWIKTASIKHSFTQPAGQAWGTACVIPQLYKPSFDVDGLLLIRDGDEPRVGRSVETFARECGVASKGGNVQSDSKWYAALFDAVIRFRGSRLHRRRRSAEGGEGEIEGRVCPKEFLLPTTEKSVR